LVILGRKKSEKNKLKDEVYLRKLQEYILKEKD